jgi:hypothetical protein
MLVGLKTLCLKQFMEEHKHGFKLDSFTHKAKKNSSNGNVK